MTALGLQLVQAATSNPADLFVWAMGDLQADLRKGAPKDAIIYFFNGAGTSAYNHPPKVAEIKAKYPTSNGTPYRHVTVAGWSAGGRAVQRWLDNYSTGIDAVSNGVDAVLLADALYTGLVDDKADPTALDSAIHFAIDAATSPEGSSPIFVFWHSSITPPGYASSGQCADVIRAAIEKTVGPMADFTPPTSFRATLTSAVRHGNCILLGYKGADAAEHIREAHLIDDAMQAFIPWCTPDCGVVEGSDPVCYVVPATDSVVEPAPISAAPTTKPTGTTSVVHAVVEPAPESTPTIAVDASADGVATPDEDAVEHAPISVKVRVIHPGMTGPDVTEWQEHLNSPAFNHAYDCGKVDGSYGTNTMRVTRAFQIDHHVGADGCVDKSTRDAMTTALLELAQANVAANVTPIEGDSLSLRRLAIALGELGQHEIPGAAQNPRIREYEQGARRNSLPVADSEDVAWCAAFVGWCTAKAARLGEKTSPWRISVAEIWQDAIHAGTAKAATYTPQPGDMILYKRNGQDPRNGGQGHVCIVETSPDKNGLFTTIGGNEGGSLHHGGEVMRDSRRVSDVMIAGYVVAL